MSICVEIYHITYTGILTVIKFGDLHEIWPNALLAEFNLCESIYIMLIFTSICVQIYHIVYPGICDGPGLVIYQKSGPILKFVVCQNKCR